MTVWQDWEELRALALRNGVNARQDFSRYWVGRECLHDAEAACRALVSHLRMVDAPIPVDLRARHINII